MKAMMRRLSVLLAAMSLVTAALAGERPAPIPGQQRLDPVPAPQADPTGLDKCRFISFVAPSGGGVSALRVHLVSLHHVDPPYTAAVTVPFTAFEGQSVWVGPSASYADSSDGFVSRAAKTQCQPHFQDWSSVGLLHVTGSAIVPSSTYRVETVSAACQGVESSEDCQSGGVNVSEKLEIRTTRWGDVDAPFSPTTAPRQPDVNDLNIMILTFKGATCQRAILPRAVIYPVNVFGEVNMMSLIALGYNDIVACSEALQGKAYPAQMGRCTGAPTPPATGACTTDAQCAGGNGAGPCLLYCP